MKEDRIKKGQRPAGQRESSFVKNESPVQKPKENLRVSIEKKAYELYEQRGCNSGQDWNDWFEAEKIVTAGKSNSR